jgi:hypothetical protein
VKKRYLVNGSEFSAGELGKPNKSILTSGKKFIALFQTFSRPNYY